MCSYEQISRFVFENWNISPRSFVTLRSVKGLIDSRGNRYVLKSVKPRPQAERLESTAKAVTTAMEQGAAVVPWIRSVSGMYYPLFEGKWWSVQPWQEGRACNFQHVDEWFGALAAAARLHCTIVDPQTRSVLTAPTPSSKYCARLDIARKAALQIRPELSGKEWASWNAIALEALEIIRKQEKASQQVEFCHRDLAPHNSIWRQGCASLIDFDLAGMDYAIHDLYQLCNHRAYFCGWNDKDIFSGIEAYNRIRPLPRREWDTFLALCRFPSFITRELYELTYRAEEHVSTSTSASVRLTWARQLERSKMESLMSLPM
ncbi:MAG: hypothetical protein JWN30_719 [Bacilli bacterium]|nr:hypothetical protein [Bacilli bacterium]